MASHKSAEKKMKQDRLRNLRNRSHKSRLRTELKKFRSLIAAGKTEEATKGLRATESILDHGATLGLLHHNAAARTKSRLARQVAALARS